MAYKDQRSDVEKPPRDARQDKATLNLVAKVAETRYELRKMEEELFYYKDGISESLVMEEVEKRLIVASEIAKLANMSYISEKIEDLISNVY